MGELLTLEEFLARATLLPQQRSFVLALNLSGARPFERWLELAQSATTRPTPETLISLSDAASLLSLSTTALAEISRYFGGNNVRPLAIWESLAERYSNDPNVWGARCGAAPAATQPPLPPTPSTGGINLPDGEGFLERHQGTLQMTPLLEEGETETMTYTTFSLPVSQDC